MQSLIEQVKRLAEESALVEMKLKSVGGHFGVEAAFNNYDHLARQFDFPALLAHMQAQQAVVDAARALDGFNTGDCYEVEIEDYETLTAALENLRSDNDGK